MALSVAFLGYATAMEAAVSIRFSQRKVFFFGTEENGRVAWNQRKTKNPKNHDLLNFDSINKAEDLKTKRNKYDLELW